MGESRNTETETYFKPKFWPKPNRNNFGLPTKIFHRDQSGSGLFINESMAAFPGLFADLGDFQNS